MSSTPKVSGFIKAVCGPHVSIDRMVRSICELSSVLPCHKAEEGIEAQAGFGGDPVAPVADEPPLEAKIRAAAPLGDVVPDAVLGLHDHLADGAVDAAVELPAGQATEEQATVVRPLKVKLALKLSDLSFSISQLFLALSLGLALKFKLIPEEVEVLLKDFSALDTTGDLAKALQCLKGGENDFQSGHGCSRI